MRLRPMISSAPCVSLKARRCPSTFAAQQQTILNWLESLPKTVLDARPALWWKQAALLLVIGQPKGVEEKLQATEAALAAAALPGADAGRNDPRPDRKNCCRQGKPGANAMPRQKPSRSRHTAPWNICTPTTCRYRSMATRSLGFAYYLQGDLAEAGRAYTEALSIAQAAGDILNTSLASIRLGQIQEEKTQLHLAAETYQHVLQLIDDYSPPNAPVAHLGLARIYYEWNDLKIC